MDLTYICLNTFCYISIPGADAQGFFLRFSFHLKVLALTFSSNLVDESGHRNSPIEFPQQAHLLAVRS
jgi:hypothetical protein